MALIQRRNQRHYDAIISLELLSWTPEAATLSSIVTEWRPMGANGAMHCRICYRMEAFYGALSNADSDSLQSILQSHCLRLSVARSICHRKVQSFSACCGMMHWDHWDVVWPSVGKSFIIYNVFFLTIGC